MDTGEAPFRGPSHPSMGAALSFSLILLLLIAGISPLFRATAEAAKREGRIGAMASFRGAIRVPPPQDKRNFRERSDPRRRPRGRRPIRTKTISRPRAIR